MESQGRCQSCVLKLHMETTLGQRQEIMGGGGGGGGWT